MNAQSKPDLHEALSGLKDRRLLRELGYVNGRWTAGAGTMADVSDPATGKLVSRVVRLTKTEAREAVAAAHAAFPAWRKRLPQERATLLRTWHDLILAAADDLALIMTLEQGKPLSESKGEIAYGASFVEWFAEEGKRLNVESVTSHLPNAEMLVRREPLGVVAVITPWNFPNAMLTRKAAAALAAGCTVVAHPSSSTPLSALALAELAERAGLPPGVFNVLPGPAAEIVTAFTSAPEVKAVSFTGSTEIGKNVAAQCTATMKRFVMELGGHAPLIIFDDAEIDRAVDIAMNAKFATSGQDCLAANRIYVQRPIYDAFNAAFAKRVSAMKVGAGLEADVEIGPLMHARAVAKVREQVDDAIARGARCLAGGTAGQQGPLFHDPTLLVDVPDDALVMREETFGPLAAVTVFDTEEDVIRRANDTEYGLVAYVVTANGARALRLSRELDYGMVAVNRVKITGGPIPFGGTKQSGIGREGSRHGIEAFTEIKYICLDAA
jgi:aspartate-semialdehyde dehydrogenase